MFFFHLVACRICFHRVNEWSGNIVVYIFMLFKLIAIFAYDEAFFVTDLLAEAGLK